jgi:hypothetical protein
VQIDDNADFLDKLELYILKYHRLIGLVLLIVLIITLFCDADIEIEEVETCCSDGENGCVQDGGAAAAPAALASVGRVAGAAGSKAGFLSRAGSSIKSGYKSTKGQYKQAKAGIQSASSSVQSAAKKYGASEKTSAYRQQMKDSKIGRFAGGINDLGSRTAGRLKDASPIFYQILYTIAFTLILAILVLPSLGFFVIGIICFFLLKDRVKKLKGL